MRVLTPLALAASSVVAFHQQHPIAPVHFARPLQVSIDLSQEDDLSSRRRLQDWNRRLQEGKYEQKYRKGCGSVGAFCGKVAGAVGATAVAMIPRPKNNGLSYGQRVKVAGAAGAIGGEILGRDAAGDWGAKKGRKKDDRLAKKAANGRRGRR
ncbi:hypothetical protein LEN26_004088 [Aphanomyces euteiches]|nr:hypothetical protein LEN26_004086 [Aphanomyces euteiches]KAH9150392.1 hypothetical protein LEN26_004088 [Aphanomyces euteiches]